MKIDATLKIVFDTTSLSCFTCAEFASQEGQFINKQLFVCNIKTKTMISPNDMSVDKLCKAHLPVNTQHLCIMQVSAGSQYVHISQVRLA
jgi:hypothetical protein